MIDASIVPGPAGLLDGLPCGVLLLSADLRILSANPYFHDLVGGTDTGRRFHDHLSVAGRIFLQTRLQQELGLSGRVEELALDIVRPDGVRVPVMLNASQERDPAERPGLVRMALWRAVSKRAYEAEVPRAWKAAQAAAAVKRDFLANISHEIRTPLYGVLGVAGALRQTSLAPDQSAMVDLIVSSGAILERLVSDVLDLSKAQAGDLRLELLEVDLARELEGTIETARLAAVAKGLTFRLELTSETCLNRRCDAVRVRQILGNLLSNAVKFTDRGTVILAICEDGADLIVVVQDEGIGFDEAIGDTLFQRFHQADTSMTRRYGGSGLGLSICKALVDQMGGTIEVNSTPGRGSRFEVRLPLPVCSLPVDSRTADPSVDLAPLRILLVEDNPTNQKVVEMLLATTDACLMIVDDGQQGVDAWRVGDWDLILMDMQMPVMDGLSAVRTIRREEAGQNRRRTPIAMLSANAMPHHREEALQAGADLHIAKPVTPVSLFSGITQAMATGADQEANAAACG